MSKERTGWIVKREGRIYVRLTYKDAAGKRRELMRRAEDRKHANQLRRQLLTELDAPNPERRIEGARMTFAELATLYKERRIVAPEYQADRKIAGMRSWERQLSFLKPVEEHFNCNRAGKNVEKLTGIGFHGFPQMGETISASLPRR